MLAGDGIHFRFSDDHRRERKVVHPFFSNAHVRQLLPAFFRHSREAVRLMGDDHFYDHHFGRYARKGEVIVEINRWVSWLALDM